MTRIWVPGDPRGYRDAEGSAIRSPAVAAALPLPAAERVNWLLANGASLVFEQWWPTGYEDIFGRVYHRRSVDAECLFVIALVENATSAPGTLKIQPSGGASAELVSYDTASTTPWGEPSWQAWFAALPLVNSGMQYHEVETTDLALRYLGVWELVRDELDTASDTMVELTSGSYAGLEAGRWICDGSVASVADLLAAIGSAKDATKRHGGGVLFSTAYPWSVTDTVEKNVADGTLGTSGFYWPFRSRRIKAGDTAEAYDLRILARALVGGGEVVDSTGVFKLSSLADSVSVTILNGMWAWYSQDSGTLDIACQSDDRLTPTAYCDDVGGTVDVASVQWVPT